MWTAATSRSEQQIVKLLQDQEVEPAEEIDRAALAVGG